MRREKIRDDYASYIAQHDEFKTAYYCDNCGYCLGHTDFTHPACNGKKFDEEISFCPKCGKSLSNNQSKSGEWILCSKKLPEKHIDVLVSFGDHDPVIAWYSEANKQWKNSSTDDVIEVEVIAWQQLPEPYKKEESK